MKKGQPTPLPNAELPEDEPTIADAVDAVKDIYDDYKSAYQTASRKDQAKILAIFLPLLLTFIIGVIGVAVANFGQYFAQHSIEIVGFVLMGVGLGGFFLTIVLLLVISKIKGGQL